jgi:protocatechuate 3,4-dioxygenase beta subunit
MKPAKLWPWQRRNFLKASAGVAGAMLSAKSASAAGACTVTPSTEDGPLYPAEEFPWASDLTTMPGQAGTAKGQIAYLYGQIKSHDCRPVSDATVEIWQADDNGYYKHPRHTAPEGLDPNFRYFAKVRTDAAGRYMIKTIVPKWYRIFDIDRAAHVHIKVRSPDNGVLTSEIYFSGADQDEIRERDPVYQSRRNKESLIVQRDGHIADPAIRESIEEGAAVCNFDVMYRI